MIVAKFGGTSVGFVENIQNIGSIISGYPAGGRVIVVSAFKGVTNLLERAGRQASLSDPAYQDIFKEIEKIHIDRIQQLIEADQQTTLLADAKRILNELEDLLHGVFLLKELSLRSMDLIYSIGERLSARILTGYFQQESLPMVYVDSRKLIITNERFGSAAVRFEETNKRIRDYFTDVDTVYMVTGFIGSTPQGETTTLGRGGSDYTASIIAAALDAQKIDIWTDVSGVYTADPRRVPSAFPLKQISYQEAMEMSHFGAKVIYPPTIHPLIRSGIPIFIRNTFKPEEEGTLISTQSAQDRPVKGISSIDEISLITLQGSGLIGVPGTSSRLFGALARYDVNIILITQASSEHSITFAIRPADAEKAIDAMQEEFGLEIQSDIIDQPVVESNLSIVAIIGDQMRHRTGISARLFNALGVNGVNVVAIAQGSSERNLSVVISRRDIEKALNLIHEAFFLSDKTTLHLFMIGAGLIGKTLLKQIKSHQEYLLKHKNLNLILHGLINTRKMLLDENIPYGEAMERIEKQGEPADLKVYTDRIIEMNKPNSIVVDVTSSMEVVKHYGRLLEHSISVVTPSKLANSSDYNTYAELHKIAKSRGSRLLFETNVGAGLPVISTLENLKLSGDRIIRIEGVLSGTLSYLFNTFDGSKPFSQLVKEARESGYTEPDPRDDLNGLDVARKILILSREAGYAMELDDVSVENLIPQALQGDNISIDAFMNQLADYDDTFLQKYQEAAARGCKLCYMATLDEGKAFVSLESISPDHPLYPLSGSDNMISFTTDRYLDRPLVIKGPGAGAAVTAAGVFADIISLQNIYS